MNDANTTVGLMKKEIAAFIRERDWEQFHSPKNLSMSITIEAAELMELFQWMDVDEARSRSAHPDIRPRLEEEIADIAIYVLSLCSALDIDLSSCVARKVEKNKKKYPSDIFRGKW